MTEKNDELERLLNADPLAEAEKITGKSYKTDDLTMDLGMLAHINNAQAKKKALAESEDTYYNCSWEEAEKVITDLGFEQILVRAFFADNLFSEEPKKRLEYQVFYWHTDGILLVGETYGGESGSMNSLRIHYNVEFLSAQEAFKVASSGHLHRESYDEGRFIWVGDHDVREGLRYKMDLLRNAGMFLPVWVEAPFLYLQHYGKEGNITVVETISQFPEEVQTAMAALDRTKPLYNEVYGG